jgi:Protein of unknown function (DUF3572)
MRKPLKPNRDEAERIALEALGYLVADEDRLWPFLGATGLEPGTIRDAAQSPGFLVAVLDYVAGNEPLLMCLAGALETKPERIMEARSVLAPEPFD